MSSRLDEELIRSRNARMAVWALLIVYITVFIYQARTGSVAATLLRDVLFGVLMAGFGVYLAAQYDSEDTLMTIAAGLFVLGGAANIVGVVLLVLGTISEATMNLTAVPVFAGVGLWLLHWIRTAVE